MLVQNSAPGIVPADVHHQLQRFAPLRLAFAGISEDHVERRTYAGLRQNVGRFVDGFQLLESLVHQPHHFGRSGVGALGDLRQAGAAHQLQLVDAQPSHKIGGRLNAPLEFDARSHNAFGDSDGAIAVHQEVVIDDPDQLQAVALREIARLFADLFRIERIPLPAVHAVVGAVAAVVGTRQAAGVHRPAPPAHTLIGVEIGQMIGLGRHLANRPKLPARGLNTIRPSSL